MLLTFEVNVKLIQCNTEQAVMSYIGNVRHLINVSHLVELKEGWSEKDCPWIRLVSEV